MAVVVITFWTGYCYSMFHIHHTTFVIFLINDHSRNMVGEDQKLQTVELLI
jgi:hypothetical protein